jgi:hypothetical protein
MAGKSRIFGYRVPPKKGETFSSGGAGAARETTANVATERQIAGITASIVPPPNCFHKSVVKVPETIEATAPDDVALFQKKAAIKDGVIAAP